MARFSGGAGAGVSAVEWTSVLVNVTVGSGTVSSSAYESGDIVFGFLSFAVAADSAISGAVSVNLPSAAVSAAPLSVVGAYTQNSTGDVFSLGGTTNGSALAFDVKKIAGLTYDALESGEFVTADSVDATHPVAYASGDVLTISFMYTKA
jgi:hypothetical protein